MAIATAFNAAFEIAPLTADDIPLIMDIAHRTWPVSYAGVLTPEQIANMLATIYSAENLQNEMATGHRFFAAYEGDAPLGFVSAYRDGDITWLRKLYILPAAQGRGIGHALMATAFEALAPALHHRLLVNRNNVNAQAFYKRLGFSLIDEVDVRMGDFAFRDFVFSRAA